MDPKFIEDAIFHVTRPMAFWPFLCMGLLAWFCCFWWGATKRELDRQRARNAELKAAFRTLADAVELREEKRADALREFKAGRARP